MSTKIWTLIAALGLVCDIATANIQSDLSAGLPLEQVLRNAVDDEGLAYDKAVAEAIKAQPDRTAEIVAAALATFCSAEATDAPEDCKEKIIQVGLQAAVEAGLTIEEAVAAMITAARDLAATIVTVAISTFCTAEGPPNCEALIVQTAIAMGIDPSVVASAAAAGRVAARAAAPTVVIPQVGTGGGGKPTGDDD